jgi:hypothetical protein
MSVAFREQCLRNLESLGLSDKKDTYKDFTGCNLEDIVKLEYELVGRYSVEVARATQHIAGEFSPRIPLKVPGTGFSLYPPQAALIFTMLRIEGDHSFVAAPHRHSINAKNWREAQSNAGFILERMSFGKSTLIPALIRYQPACKWTPRPSRHLYSHGPQRASGPCIDNINVILASRITLDEWGVRLKRTNMPFVLVKSKKGITDTQALIDKRPAVGIVIIRSGAMKVDGVMDTVLSHFSRAFGPSESSRGFTFSRVFYDDFDMLELDNAIIPLARFHWLFSATADPIKIFPGHREEPTFEDGFYTCTSGAYKGKAVSENSFGAFAMMDGLFRQAFFSARCNTNFAQLEFNVPPIEWASVPDLEGVPIRLVKGEPIDATEFKHASKTFITSSNSIKYDREQHGVKVLVSVESKKTQIELVAKLIDAGVDAVLLDKRNVHLFGKAGSPVGDAKVGVSRLIHGISMGYLSHVVVLDKSYTCEQVDQIVGRAQRLGRKHNLQVYMIPCGFDAGYHASWTADPTARLPEGCDPEYRAGYEEGMQENGIEACESPIPAGAHPEFIRGVEMGLANNHGYPDGINGNPRTHDYDDCPHKLKAYTEAYDSGVMERDQWPDGHPGSDL